MRWQLTFPGNLPARLALASGNRKPVGCAGLTPREFFLAGRRVEGYLLSFVAVDPVSRGHGLAARLYETLLSGLPREVPIVAFSQPDSTGERVLLKAFESSFAHQPLRPCRAFGYAPTSGTTNEQDATHDATVAEFIDQSPLDASESVLWNAPSSSVLRHYLNDPRPRSLMVVADRQGRPAGTAMRVAVEMTTGDAVQRVPMLENVRLSDRTSDVLRSAFTAAGESAPGAVIASNLSHIDETIVKAARARALPSLYRAHLFCGVAEPKVDATNIEVI